MPTVSDYLQQSINGVLSISVGLWVQLVNNATSTAYVSTAATDGTGKFTVNNVPAGTYTVNTGPTASGPWTATGDGNYQVQATAGDGTSTFPGAVTVQAGGVTVAGASTFTGAVTTPNLALSGGQASRYVVNNAAFGAPTTGAHLVGDWTISNASGSVFVCTVAGTPGTWVVAGGMVNLLDYGVKGDNSTDETTSTNNAIAAAGTSGVVLCPTPSIAYRINGVISNPNSVPLLMLGQALFSGSGAPTANIIRLGAIQQLYVSSTGSDSNPGTSALPFLTLQRAVNVAAPFAGAGVGITINVASGSYVGFVYSSNGLPFNSSGSNSIPPGITISGGWGGGTTTITKGSGPACIITQGYGASIYLTGAVTISSTSTGLFANQGSIIAIIGTGVTFAACTGAHMHADTNGLLQVNANYAISGGSVAHLECSLRGTIIYAENAITVTLTGSPVFSIAFASAQDSSLIYVGNSFVTFSGAAGATTPRFSLRSGAILETNNGSATYLPGTATGQLSGNGRYLPLPAPSITSISAGFGAGATIAPVAGATDQEGYLAITTGTGTGNSGTFTFNTSTTGPNAIGAPAFVLHTGGGTWNARASVQTSSAAATSIVVSLDNNAVNFPVSTTLYLLYSLRPF